VNWSAELVAEVWPPTTTVTSTIAVEPDSAGLTAVQEVVEVQLTEVAATEPKFTVVALVENPVPVIATVVPPVAAPLAGLMEVTVGPPPPPELEPT
jgi:hypothetical protein